MQWFVVYKSFFHIPVLQKQYLLSALLSASTQFASLQYRPVIYAENQFDEISLSKLSKSDI